MNRAQPLAEWPILKAKTAAGKRAAELHAEWAEQHKRIAAVEQEHASAQEALRAANARLRDAHYEANKAGKSGKDVAEAEAAFLKAEEEANAPWSHRLEAPIRSAEDARSAFQIHVTETLDELLDEPDLAEAAVSARDAVIAATEAQSEAIDGWLSAHRAHELVLAQADGITAQALPSLPMFVGDLRRTGEELLMGEGRPGRLAAPCLPARQRLQRRLDRGESELVKDDSLRSGAVKVVHRR